ncbi:prepilin peptidase [Candidatus Woesearchaeota archaeon]|nr:prepilin peptidase [Candidatus Woesearchaeota archaeon]
MQQLIHLVVLAALAVGSYTDFKTREVPDWLNYGLIVFGVGVNLLLSIVFWTWSYIAYSIIGLALFIGIACALYYSGQWGGGDSKMLIGLGAVFGLPISFAWPYVSMNAFLIAFWFNLLMAGVVYAMLWSIYLLIKNYRKFLKEAGKEMVRKRKMRRLSLAAAIAALIAAIAISDFQLKLLLTAAGLLTILTIYYTIYSKAIEKAGMHKLVTPAELTEGDWVVEDVKAGNKLIASPKDLGVTKKQIKILKQLYAKRKIRKVLIKVGLPFVPSFFAAMLLTIQYGNLFMALAGLL